MASPLSDCRFTLRDGWRVDASPETHPRGLRVDRGRHDVAIDRRAVATLAVVTIEALTFVLSAGTAGSAVGAGMVAPDARYACIWLIGADRPERLHPGSKTWRAILAELESDAQIGPLPRQSWLFVLLTNNSTSLSVDWTARESVTVDALEQAVTVLDGRLRALLPRT